MASFERKDKTNDLVTCKECKNSEYNPVFSKMWCNKWHGIEVYPEHSCIKAERREDERLNQQM